MPNGHELLSCSYDGTVRVWDWHGKKETRRFAKTDGWHYGFHLSPDGKTLILPTGQVWNVATGEQVRTVPNYQGLQSPAKFSPDGKRLAAPKGAIAVVVDVTTGKEISRFTEHEPLADARRSSSGGAQVYCAAFSPDGRFGASGGIEGLAFVWDATSGKVLRRLQGHKNPIIDVAFSPDGRMVATASGDLWNHIDATVRLWEVATGKERRRFAGHQAQVTSVVFSRGGTTLISGSEDGTALQWDVAGVLNFGTLKRGDPELWWHALESKDAAVAYEALCAFALQRDFTLLAERLKPVEASEAARVDRLLTELDSNAFTTREQAQQKLAELKSWRNRHCAGHSRKAHLRKCAAVPKRCWRE